jgi:hypothetical protein
MESNRECIAHQIVLSSVLNVLFKIPIELNIKHVILRFIILML